MIPLPVGVGKVIPDPNEPGSYFVQTLDRLWALMIIRMKAQVAQRAIELSAWESQQQQKQAGVRANAWYWERYKEEKSKLRVDYPMPWGHVMFGRK